MKTSGLLLSICALTINLRGAEKQPYAIPGQNGLGSEPEYIIDSTGINANIHRVATPDTWLSADLGQQSCMNKLHQSLQTNQDASIIHATSQATATALNYLAQHPEEQAICKD